jgi:AraC-like DNA-binding protein
MKIRVTDSQLEEIEGLSSEYPFVLHHAVFPETHVPWHWHEEFEFDYVISGTLKLTISGNDYTFSQNEAVFLNSNVLCTMGSDCEQNTTIVDSFLFHSILLGGHFKSVFETKYIQPVSQNKNLQLLEIRGTTKREKQILSKLKRLSALQKEKNKELQTRNLLSEIWLLLLEEIQERKVSDVPVNSLHQERIQTMISYIHKNYPEKITLEDIARSAVVSKRECLRCFQNIIHKTPFEYLLDYRIEVAQKLLRTSQLSILDIALQTGFSSEAYFCKVFKRLCGKTPNTYRKTYLLKLRT